MPRSANRSLDAFWSKPSLDANGAITTFTVDEGTAPADSRVTISTELPVRGGFLGLIEGTIVGHFITSDLRAGIGESGEGRYRAIWGLEVMGLHEAPGVELVH